jgi:hypothetical protein
MCQPHTSSPSARSALDAAVESGALRTRLLRVEQALLDFRRTAVELDQQAGVDELRLDAAAAHAHRTQAAQLRSCCLRLVSAITDSPGARPISTSSSLAAEPA